MMLLKQYDSQIDVVMEDGKLLYVKQCDHCGKEFKAPRLTRSKRLGVENRFSHIV